MKHYLAVALMGVIAFAAAPAEARPISYKGGWTVMQYNEADNSSLLIHYTVDPRTSVGLRIEDMTYGDHRFVGGQVNHLLKRWNKPDSQANMYLKMGVGIADGDFNIGANDQKAAGFARFSADWEDRRWFISGDAYAYAREGRGKTGQQARIGVAPYVAEAGALHTWLMLQADWKQNRDALQGEDAFTVTPLVRFFQGSSLLELGYSSNEEALVNFIYRF